MQIDGRRVLLTGANRGLGKALARTFIAAGGVKVYPSVRGTQKCGENVHS
jgi:NAD(P)-dependent dehydrogenase (short-subunit alcohol dehydrogenase family)